MTAPEDRGVSTRDALDWRASAACADGNPETAALFFCVGSTWDNPRDQARAVYAKAICARCPVQHQCRAWALATGQPYAIAGGLTDTERRERGSRGRPPGPPPPCGTPAGHRRHLRNDETPCEPCRLAANRERDDNRRRKAAAA